MRKAYLLVISIVLIMILPAILCAQEAIDRSSFRILEHTSSYIDIEFQLPQWNLETENRGGQILSKVVSPGANYLFIDEEETLPIFSTAVAIPYSGGAELSIQEQDQSSRTGLQMSFGSALASAQSEGRISGQSYPETNVLISEPKILRDYRIVTINVMPFQYDRTAGTLKVNDSMRIRVNLNSRSSVNEMAAPAVFSSSFDQIYRGLILNYDQVARRNQTYLAPKLLVIYGNYAEAEYNSKIAEYLAWKRQQGYQVQAASTATTGTTATAIKAYIQNAYNNTELRPEYIVLIGDDSGSFPVPTFNTYMDYHYTWLAGDDNLGDVVIGRISASTTSELINYLSKVFYNDRDLSMDDPSWLNRMVLVGDTSPSGISTVYTSKYIKEVSSVINPDYQYTEVYGSDPSSTTINAAINSGVAFYNYRGYIGMSGWPSTMNNIFTPNRLFHAVFITCATGSWGGGTSTTEQIVRMGSDVNRIGAVTAIGMATSSTHTSMNNCLNLGIMHGIYPLGMRNMGEAMLLGKLHLDMAYGNSNPDDAVVFSQFCNLIGDPTTSVHVGIPSTFSLEHQSTLPAGSSSLELVVKDSDQNPVSGAVTTLTNASGLQVLAQTDELGTVALNFPGTTTGELTIAVTKDDYIPSVSTTTISSAGNLVYSGLTVDDDNSGASSGNSNGLIDAGETMELFISLRNSSTSSLSGSATVSLVGNYATLQTTTANFGTVAAGAIAQNLAPIVLSLLPDAPDQHQVILRLSGTNAAGQWMVPLLLTINNGRLVYDSYVASGAVQNVINPGDQFNFTVGLGNEGSNALAGLTAVLSSLDPMFEIIDPNGAYPQIQPGTVQQNSGDYFIVHARAQCQTGTVVPMELALTNSSGYAQTIHFTVTLGNSTVFDPLGQDAYGYFIYDEGDTSYQLVPEYDWLGIAPSEGGSGTQLALTDPGSNSDEGDQVGSVTIQTVNLPFSFSFYGRSYDRASISSNGFIAFGETANSDWRNWRLPGPGGNNPMLAVFWDDLEIGTGAGVYTYYDSDMNYFVVEWHNLLASNRTSEETFQAILYDPLFYPTSTGDGQIKLQYKVFNNTDTGHGAGIPHGNYSTIGIKDHTGLVGLEYTFNNTYPTAAAPLSHESSLFISTRPTLPDQAYLMYENTLIVDESITLNGLLEPGEIADMTISIGNMGMVPATGVYAVLESTDPMVEVLGDYSTFADVASLGSVSSDSYYGVTIDETCPNEHILGLRLRISSDSGSWIYPVRLKVHTPDLQIDGHSITEITGNMNDIIDPGETATMTVTLTNHGAVESPAGNAVIACHNVGISILEGSANFPAIPGYQSVDLNFTVSAASSMSQGSYVTFDITATAGEILLNHAIPMEIGAPIVVQIGTGATTQSYPLDRYYNFSVHESIYLASEIAHVGDIKALAFNKASGTDTNPIENVTIYMKHTTASTLSSGAYSLAGYTQVFSGAFPNTATSGWMEINLSPMFQYDGMSNLSILIVKEHQAWISYYPQWYYTSSSSRARQERNDNALPSTLASSNNLPNIRFKLFTTCTSILYPARNLSASSSHQSVSLSWDAPISGTPTQYKIFRNSSLLTSVTSLSYLDLAVNNGTSYSYYVVAMYGTESSDPTESVSATPNALPPTNLTADPGNMSVTLSWNAPSGREPQQMLLAPGREKTTDSFGLETDSDSNRQISSYRVYRNGSPIANVTETSYQDTGLINGQSYDYYVSTVYTNPAGESAASNVVSSTPIMVSFAVLGTGTSITTSSTIGPINLTYKSTHCQAVYTADELHALGVFGPIYINQLGFFVSSPPNLALTNFQIRMAHITATNATSWITQNLQTVFNPTTYMPTAGGFDMIQFHTPFLWDGTSNILIDTANGLVAEWSYSGTFQYTSRASGILRIYSDTVDQSYIFSGGTPASYRPNLRLGFQPIQTGPEIELSTDNLSFGNVELDTNSSLSFSISNPGDQELTGTIVSPAPFSVSLSESRAATQAQKAPSQERNTISYNVPAGQSIVVSVSFSPSLPQAYNGQIAVNSNAADAQNISVAGTGIVTSLEQPVITIIESAGQISLNWESIQHADLYRIYRSDTPTSGFELIDSTSSTSWTDLTPPAKAFYRVEAYRNPPLSRQ